MRRLLLFSVALASCGNLCAVQAFDVIVYGATASGALGAIAASKEGMKTALVEPGQHVGGMVSGGLGETDRTRQEQLIGGYTREFFERVGRIYGQRLSWEFEPKVAEGVFREWLREAGVSIFFNHRLNTIAKSGARIVKIGTENGDEFAAGVFIDASYEGDLMKAAGVSYAIGREGKMKYAESLAGRQELVPGLHQFQMPVSATISRNGPLLPYMQPIDAIGLPGEGDKKIQSYCFRICLSSAKQNQLPIPLPKDYEPARYGLVRNYLMRLKKSATLEHFLGMSDLPHKKTDVNSAGPVSLDLPGASWEYPDASYKRRAEIWDEHLQWAQGLLYFLGHDESVPQQARDEMNQYGLPKDEFPDTDHWPHQLYVREARRMVGEYVMTQYDLQTQRTKYDSIGMGGYNIDIREVQWVAVPFSVFPMVRSAVVVEGYLSVPVQPYEIPYRSLLPRYGECSNLLVTSCISASHVAYASYRMEPQYMIAGHSAGVAAALSVKSRKPVHLIDIAALQDKLRAQQQILSLDPK